jgi:hypothetical protein
VVVAIDGDQGREMNWVRCGVLLFERGLAEELAAKRMDYADEEYELEYRVADSKTRRREERGRRGEKGEVRGILTSRESGKVYDLVEEVGRMTAIPATWDEGGKPMGKISTLP